MKARAALFVTGLGLLAAYEVLAHVDEDDPAISGYVWRACDRYGPIVPFVFGCCAGHLFWQATRTRR